MTPEEELALLLDGGTIPGNPNGPEVPPWPDGEGAQLIDWVMPAAKTGYGITSREELREQIGLPEGQLSRRDAWVLGWMEDLVTQEAIWTRLVAADPNDLEAANKLGELRLDLRGPEAAIEALKRSSGKTAVLRDDRQHLSYSPGFMEAIRCTALFRAGQLDAARQACLLAGQFEGQWGQRTLGKVLLAMGQPQAALAHLAKLAADPNWASDPRLALTYGVALQVNGREQEAREVWQKSQARYPGNEHLKKALSSPARSIQEWEKDEQRDQVEEAARHLANCGHFYAELGMVERSSRCYAESDRLAPGPAAAHRIVHLAEIDPKKALPLALQEAKANRHPLVLSAVGWVYNRLGNYPEARKWGEQSWALEWTPGAAEVLQVACGELDDYPCAIRFRKMLGMSSHLPGKGDDGPKP